MFTVSDIGRESGRRYVFGFKITQQTLSNFLSYWNENYSPQTISVARANSEIGWLK